jgi:hypothetical protein
MKIMAAPGQPLESNFRAALLSGGRAPIRWTFTDVSPESFRWLGEARRPDGKTWKLEAGFAPAAFALKWILEKEEVCL